MSSPLVLDTGPLSRACSPYGRRSENQEFLEWLRGRAEEGVEICIPEIADYEVRRGLLHVRASGQLRTLDRFERFTFLPLNREAMLLAATFWAEGRRHGTSTADPRELDCDVVLAAQASLVGGAVITENAGPLGRFVAASGWRGSVR